MLCPSLRGFWDAAQGFVPDFPGAGSDLCVCLTRVWFYSFLLAEQRKGRIHTDQPSHIDMGDAGVTKDSEAESVP